MKKTLLVFLALLQLTPTLSRAGTYQWLDAEGVTHFSDDPDSIPRRYQKRARELDISVKPAPAAPKPPQSPSVNEPKGGQQGEEDAQFQYAQEQEWRSRFAPLKDQVKALQDGLPAKLEKLAALRRKRAVYMRAQDREAVNRMQDEIAADQASLAELQGQLADLNREADTASIPAEWRR